MLRPECAQIAGPRRLQVSRTLCVAALIWIVFLLAIISVPRSAWINSVASLAALALGACWYFWGRPRKPAADAGPSPKRGSDTFVHSTGDGI